MHKFYEFFAGGGMARAGLGAKWRCVFANDFDSKKAACYAANWEAKHLRVGDVAEVAVADLPGVADLVWASFPCQDLSLAGAGAGLNGERSGTFWPFWKLMRRLQEDERAPRLIALENVCGALHSHNGEDFAAIGAALAGAGYRFGAMVIDAAHFLPQSRPRLFIIGVRGDTAELSAFASSAPDPAWHPDMLVRAYHGLSRKVASKWVWWKLPAAPLRKLSFADIIEDEPLGVKWHTPEETRRLLGMMSEVNRKKVEKAKKAGKRVIGGIYRRTRLDALGRKIQRAEVRFDNLAGCLRTPTGGSSRQSILLVEGESVRSRLLAPREAARLMGLPETYTLPANYNDAYHLAGDGVAVPVVRFLAAHLLEPLLAALMQTTKKKAA